MTAVPPQLRKMLAPLKSCSRGKAVAGYWAFAVPLRPRSPTVCAIHRRTCTLSGSLRALVGSYAKNVADDVQKNDLEPLRRKLERQRKKAEKRGAKKK